MKVNEENRPYLRVYSECPHCGFYTDNREAQMDLESLNSTREDNDLKPLKKLPVIELN